MRFSLIFSLLVASTCSSLPVRKDAALAPHSAYSSDLESSSNDFSSADEDDFQIISFQAKQKSLLEHETKADIITEQPDTNADIPPVSESIIKQIRKESDRYADRRIQDKHHFRSNRSDVSRYDEEGMEQETDLEEGITKQERFEIREEQRMERDVERILQTRPDFWTRMTERVMECNNGRSLWCDMLFGTPGEGSYGLF